MLFCHFGFINDTKSFPFWHTSVFFSSLVYAIYASRLKLLQKMCNKRYASSHDQVGTKWNLLFWAGSSSYAKLYSQASSILIHTAHYSASQGTVGSLSLLPLTLLELLPASFFLTFSPTLHITWYWTNIFCVKTHTGLINTTQKPGSKEQRVLCVRINPKGFDTVTHLSKQDDVGTGAELHKPGRGVCLKNNRHRSEQDGGYCPPIMQ